MAKLSAVLYKNDFSSRLGLPGIKLKVQNMSWKVLGGPESATLEGTGDWEADEAIEFLRAPIEIFGENGDCVWWGFINDIQITEGPIEYGVSMDTVFNDIMVMYPRGSTGSRIETYWSSIMTPGYDNDSIAKYGYKQKQESTNAPGQSAGDTYRLNTLYYHRYPTPTITHRPNPSKKSYTDKKFTLKCRGWFDTLDWMYYEGVVKRYDDISTRTWHNTWTAKNVGGSGVRAIAQKFTYPYAGKITSVGFNLAASGEPGKKLKLYLMADTGATPGDWSTAYDTAEVSVQDIQQYGGYEWDIYKFENGVTKTAGTSAWIIADGQGDDLDGWFQTWVKEVGGATSVEHNGTSWGAPGTAFNMIYRLYMETTNENQIQDLVTQAGQFLTLGSIPATGISTEAKYGTKTTAKSVLEELCNMGTTNGNPLKISISRNRVLYVEEDLAGTASQAKLSLGKDGMLYNKSGGELYPAYQNPCGQWCVVEGLVPSTISSTRNVDVSRFRIDRAVYHSGEDRNTLDKVTVEPKGQVSPFNTFLVENR